MKKLLVLTVGLMSALAVNAQAGIADAHSQAMEKANRGDFDKAISIIKSAEVSYPDNAELLQDETFLYTAKKDYDKAIAAGKRLIALPDADQTSFQVLGSAYRAAARYSDAEKVYEDGLQKFPNSGFLYAEYGQTLNDNKKTVEAAKAWERGVELSPSISSNYYFLAKYYAAHNNPLWSVLYGEIFVNIESFSQRTSEIRGLLLNQYAALFATDNVLQNYVDNGQPFEKAVASTFAQFKDMISGGATPESLFALRGQFIVNWFNSDNAKNFPFKLFDRQQQLLKLGIFESYNQWLFAGYNQSQFKTWAQMHDGEVKEFSKFQQSSMFKVPEGQYYAHL